MKQEVECEVVVHSTALGQHMNPPSLTRPKSMGTIVVDMGNHRGDAELLRLKSNGAMSVDAYSPAKKTSRPEPVSRIHCIPLLMMLVFFILWTASSEYLPEVKTSSEDATPVMKMPTVNKFATSEEQKGFNNEVSQHGTRTVLNHNNNHLGSYLKGDGPSHSLEYYRTKKRQSVRGTYMRGAAT